ncbi:hypothetical protein D5085_02420 [Ectothiorhodospiraceae bacterium BW-2]|nr:hypothetical protein D5085_02420 [Ectothiorhodospiraceae bacterium BW-2]
MDIDKKWVVALPVVALGGFLVGRLSVEPTVPMPLMVASPSPAPVSVATAADSVEVSEPGCQATPTPVALQGDLSSATRLSSSTVVSEAVSSSVDGGSGSSAYVSPLGEYIPVDALPVDSGGPVNVGEYVPVDAMPVDVAGLPANVGELIPVDAVMVGYGAGVPVADPEKTLGKLVPVDPVLGAPVDPASYAPGGGVGELVPVENILF